MGIVLIIAILAVVVFASGCTQPNNNNTTVQNNTTQPQNTTNVTNATNIVAVQKGPETAKKGMNVTIQYEVTNNGNETVFNVQINSQNFGQAVGTLKPGETKKYTSQWAIPTDAQVQQDFGSNATVPNPFPIAGFGVTFNDANGGTHSILSNPIEIQLS